MNYSSSHKPTTLNLDKSFASLSETESYYLLNHLALLNINGKNGNNMGKGKPLPANFPACEIDQPGGENYTVGGYRSPLTNEFYSWHYNSNGVHYVLRTSNSGCEIVYHGCLSISAEPRHSIEQFRAYMWLEKICNNRDGKQIVWTNGDAPVGMLDIEASIATNFFTTDFFNRCSDPCAYVQMCVPEICGCIQAEFMPLEESEVELSNFILDAPFQFAIKHVYYDNRESEWSDRSSVYYQDTKGCFDTEAGYPRCLKLRIPIGNPMVDKIKIAFTTGLRNETGGLIWYLYDTVEKYKKYNNNQQKWYDRDLAELLNYSDEDCSFDYVFCNDKSKQLIDPKEMIRVRNPIPRKPQAILAVKDGVGLVNYEDGNCPVDKVEIQKLDININCDQQQDECAGEYVNVTFRAIIHNSDSNINQFVFREAGDGDDPDVITDPAFFGGIDTNDNVYEIGFGQKFKGKTRNFIGYVEGTNYWAEAKQWQSNPSFNTRSEVGILAGMVFEPRRSSVMSNIYSGSRFYYQEFKIRVKKGTRGYVRLTSHNSVDGVGNAQDKSTFVIGTIPNITMYNTTASITDILDNSKKEVYFDSCNGDVTLNETFIIQDMAINDTSSSYSGYISDANGQAVGGALIYNGSDLISITDHNGFYDFYSELQDVTPTIVVEMSCSSFGLIQTMTIQAVEGGHTDHDETITSVVYKDDFYLIVKQRVVDCSGLGIVGVRVAISGSKYKVTDSSGMATFKLRNYSTRNREVRTIVMDGGGCISTDCANDCNPCMPTNTDLTPECYYRKPQLNLPSLIVNRASIVNQSGLKSSGRYGFGVVAESDCGELSAVYELKYIDIPKTQAKNRLNFCRFDYNGNGISLSGWKCLKIVRTINLNPFELQWKVDKIEKTGDGKIKLTIQSLNDYNTKYFNETNTIYQWLKGDRIEFIKNGDGSILTIAEHGLLNYLTISPFNDELLSEITDDANFFNQLLISDDGRLDDITEGAIIELQRPTTSTTSQVYYQICATIPIKPDGRLLYETGTFSTFDTYLVNRTIGSFTGTFEHHSPSDFWGNRISDVGKAYVVNPYENERRYGRNISINSPTQFNYFGDLVKKFDAPGQGDITAIDIVDGKLIRAICEQDNFLAPAADDFVRVGSDNIIRALPVDSIIGDTQLKAYGAFGCQYDHIGSVYFGDGYFSWVDVNRTARIRHDYNAAKDVAEGRVQTYYRIRCQDIETYNLNTTDPLDKFRFCTGFDQSNGMLYQTIKRLRDQGFNNEQRPFQINNDTILFHPVLDEWFGFASFTGEFYGNLDLKTESGCAFICFFSGVPYIHPIISERFNEFFGIPCDEIMCVTLNKFTEKMKLALAMEVQSDMLWFSPEITNGKDNFVSEIPPVRWKKSNDKWDAAFLNNKNSRSGLYGNNGGVAEGTRGFYVNVLLVKDNTDGLIYNSINNQKRIAYNESDNIFIKCQLIEESGFTSNL